MCSFDATYLIGTECALATVGDVKETIFVLMFVIDCCNQSPCWRYDVIHKQEDSLISLQTHVATHFKHELADSDVARYKVLLLINVRGICVMSLLNDHRHKIGILGLDSVRNLTTLLCNVHSSARAHTHKLDRCSNT